MLNLVLLHKQHQYDVLDSALHKQYDTNNTGLPQRRIVCQHKVSPFGLMNSMKAHSRESRELPYRYWKGPSHAFKYREQCTTEILYDFPWDIWLHHAQSCVSTSCYHFHWINKQLQAHFQTAGSIGRIKNLSKKSSLIPLTTEPLLSLVSIGRINKRVRWGYQVIPVIFAGAKAIHFPTGFEPTAPVSTRPCYRLSQSELR